MYDKLIKRKLGFLVEKNLREERKKYAGRRFSFFSENKRKEILVWMWLQEDKDKDQIKDFIKDKFHVSEQDAEKLYYEAFPDGTTSDEDETLDELNSILIGLVGIQPTIVSDTIGILTNTLPGTALEKYELPKNVQNQVKLVISSMLQRRKLL